MVQIIASSEPGTLLEMLAPTTKSLTKTMYLTKLPVSPDVHSTLRRSILDEVQQGFTILVDLPYGGQVTYSKTT